MGVADQGHAGRSFAVFEIGGEVFSIQDVVRAAEFLGASQGCREKLLAGWAAAQRATQRGLEPAEGAVQSMSDAFRYERDLITAEEAERWLRQRGLNLEDLNDFILRRYWRSEAPETEPGDPPAEPSVERLLVPELMLSGEFDRTAIRLSRRLVARHADNSAGMPTRETVESARSRFLDRSMLTEAGIPEWLARVGGDPDWLERMLTLEAGHRAQCQNLLNTQARRRALRTLRLPLTRIEVEVLELKSEDAAREAFLCVGQDGVSMVDLAGEGGHPYRRVELLLGDLDAELRRVFLSAAPGEVLAPIENEGTYQLCRLVEKTEPDLGDAEVRRRVDERILDSFFDELTARQVRWLLPAEAAE